MNTAEPLPHPIKPLAGNDYRVRVPVFVTHETGRHRFGRFSVPIGDYVQEIIVRRNGVKSRPVRLRHLAIRQTVEVTLGLKFPQGARSFYQWLLKHQAPTRWQANRLDHLGKNNRRKVEQPTLRLNPAVKSGRIILRTMRKRNGRAFVQHVGSLSNHRPGINLVVLTQYFFSDQPEEQAARCKVSPLRLQHAKNGSGYPLEISERK